MHAILSYADELILFSRFRGERHAPAPLEASGDQAGFAEDGEGSFGGISAPAFTSLDAGGSQARFARSPDRDRLMADAAGSAFSSQPRGPQF